ncbi:hypothetical protein J18TS1_43420 [Oceanobacillus oncorhynchi subsp. incaldanensis]|nr:hypothetical protein J18TS1_43420 [Oceanobacillus oncorhynchi subsp. incaldanensis]
MTTDIKIITDVEAGMKIIVTAGNIKETSSITDAETSMKMVVVTGTVTETIITDVVNRIIAKITGIKGSSVFAVTISTN